ncbi:MAG: hypothetical protein J5845_06280 [Lachnospiraceae bacterium]|nr:hypothetical protein [Lachnospiraceae bacterium]
MLWFFTAIYPEAAPVVSRYAMKRTAGRFADIFRGEDAVLVLTGSGPVRAASAVSEALTLDAPGPKDILINLGICGAPEGYAFGECCRIHKITDACSCRDFYPDLLADSAFREAALTTYGKPCEAPETLADMEGSAFFETAVKAVSPDRIFLYKIVSDRGNTDALTPQTVTNLIAKALPGIISEAERYASLLPEPKELSAEAEEAADGICRLLDASVTMRSEIMKLALYIELRDGNAAERLRAFLNEEGISGEQPLRRKEGKIILEHLRQFCLR